MTNEPTIIIEPDVAGLAQKGAEIFSRSARKSVGAEGRFMVALSGGSTPRDMHRLLAEEPFLSDIPWDRTDIFWVDDRCVPENDPASNYGAARQDFLDRIPIPRNRIHPMPAVLPPQEGALMYQKELISSFQSGESDFPQFDLVFLGIGADGHTASLFPGQRALEEKSRLIIAVRGGNPNVSRLTMTFPLLNRAREIIFLVSGKKKAETVKTIIEYPEARLPAQEIQSMNGTLTWIMDRESASMLSKEYFP